MALVDSENLQVKTERTPGQHRLLFWASAVHGHGGINYWMTSEPMVNPVIPGIRAEISSVSDILLPRPRIRGKIALLYPYESFRGLPLGWGSPEELPGYMDFYAGLLFSQIPADFVSCRKILAKKHASYPLLCLPYAALVKKGVFEEVSSWVKSGGKIFLTGNSLLMDDYRYEKLPVQTLLAGKSTVIQEGVMYYSSGSGGVYYMPEPLGLEKTARALQNICLRENIKCDLTVSAEKDGEFPYIEAQIIGDQNRFIIYAVNWGGMTKKCTIKINSERFIHKNYSIRNVETGASLKPLYSAEEIKSGLPLVLDSQDPKILLFEPENIKTVLKFPAAGRMETLKKIEAMNRQNQYSPGKPAVLFITHRDEVHFDMGRASTPIVADLLEKNGAGAYEYFDTDLDEKTLAQFQLIFIVENYQYTWKQIAARNPQAIKAIRNFIEQGGSLFINSCPMVGENVKSAGLMAILGPSGISRADYKLDPVWFSNPQSCFRNDPLQVIFKNMEKHEITAGVREMISLCATPVIDKNKLLVPVIKSATDDTLPEQTVLAAGTIGKGRVVVSGDAFFMQPFRVEYGDNVKLLWNSLRWLLHEKVPEKNKDELLKQLLFAEKDIESWEKEEKFR
ncbi:MAG: hypothetical protein A2096_09565 [Spirochaetes bacterium GWF1_41_5]|nr:MAG: hypothetical protein A2096_09565 [Spirochaetes bacterium GWF1_41_5]